MRGFASQHLPRRFGVQPSAVQLGKWRLQSAYCLLQLGGRIVALVFDGRLSDGRSNLSFQVLASSLVA